MSKQNITALAYDKRGRLLSLGRCSYTKTHPIQASYANKSVNNNRIFLHAEIDALIKADKQVYKMVIIRKGRSGQLLASKPCDMCLRALVDYGVEVLEYIEPTDRNIQYNKLIKGNKEITEA